MDPANLMEDWNWAHFEHASIRTYAALGGATHARSKKQTPPPLMLNWTDSQSVSRISRMALLGVDDVD